MIWWMHETFPKVDLGTEVRLGMFVHISVIVLVVFLPIIERKGVLSLWILLYIKLFWSQLSLSNPFDPAGVSIRTVHISVMLSIISKT